MGNSIFEKLWSNVRARKGISSVIGLAAIGAAGFVALDALAFVPSAIDSGTGAENGRVVGQLTVSGISGSMSVRSFTWGGQRPEGVSSAKFTQGQLVIGKSVDSTTSFQLFNLAARGTNIATVTLTVPATGTSVATTYTLTNATIVSYTNSDKGRPTGGQPIEQVAFFYQRVRMTAGTTVTCWDFPTGTPC